MHALDDFLDKFGVCTSDLQHYISTTLTNSQDRATAQGKYSKLTDTSVLLCCVFRCSH